MPEESFKVETKLLEDEPDFENADLVILHQMPNSDIKSRAYLQKIMAAKKPVFFILGTQAKPQYLKRFFPRILHNVVRKAAVT